MIGLGAGSISTYLGRAMPDVQIDTVELDPEIIAAGKKYFGLEETDKVPTSRATAATFLNRNKEPYDLIILDAYRELGVPFHMLTPGILYAREGSPRARWRGRGQRYRQHQALPLDVGDLSARYVSDR